jgi:hypothetical protein
VNQFCPKIRVYEDLFIPFSSARLRYLNVLRVSLSYLSILNCAIKLIGDSTLESVQYLILCLVASNLKVLILQLPSQFCAGFGSLGLMTSVLVTIIIPKPKSDLNHHEDCLAVVGFERLFIAPSIQLPLMMPCAQHLIMCFLIRNPLVLEHS